MTQTDGLGRAAPLAMRERTGSRIATTVSGEWSEAEPRWQRLAERSTALPFARASWLRPWYRHCTVRDVEPVILFLHDRDTGQDLLALPLVRRREGALRVVCFADNGLTDYNAAPFSAAATSLAPAALWAAIRKALPPADLLRFEKMPAVIDGRTNPLAGLPGVTPSALIGNILHIPGTWDAWLRGQERHFRKELGRCRRVFEKHPEAAFRRYGAGPEGIRVYEGLRKLQAARIAELGLPYILDDEPARGFYDTVVEEGLADGTAVLTALTIGDEVVAASTLR